MKQPHPHFPPAPIQWPYVSRSAEQVLSAAHHLFHPASESFRKYFILFARLGWADSDLLLQKMASTTSVAHDSIPELYQSEMGDYFWVQAWRLLPHRWQLAEKVNQLWQVRKGCSTCWHAWSQNSCFLLLLPYQDYCWAIKRYDRCFRQ